MAELPSATPADLFARARQLHQAGDPARAEPLYRQVLAAEPSNAHAHYLHGAACQALGRLEDAAASLRTALRLRPGFAEVHNHLGVTLARQGRPVEAEAAFREAVRLRPIYAEARSNLGNALVALGRLPEARTCFDEALRLRPNYAEAHSNRANTLAEQGELEDAAAGYREALRLNPRYVPARLGLGTVLQRQGRLDEAVALFREALQLLPSAEAHDRLGAALVACGDLSDAVAHYREALRLQPAYAPAYYSLSELVRQGQYALSVEEKDRIRNLLTAPALSANDRVLLHFALAYALEKEGADEEAFQHYQEGNELRRQYLRQRGQGFEAERRRSFIDRIIATFSRDFFARAGVGSVAPSTSGLDTELPIFVVGMPRSGTTLVEQILASHTEVFGAGEVLDVQQIALELPTILGTTEPYPECVRQLTRAIARDLAERYLHRLSALGGSARRVVDKLPENYLHLGLIALLFPRARIIQCRRDPRDVCLSCYVQDFKAVRFACSLDDLAAYYRAYERLMAHWREALPLSVLDVRYEELVADPEAQSRRLVAFCGLAWNEHCLAFHETRRAVQTASRVQVRQPVYTSSVGRWRRYAAQLRPLIEALGREDPPPRSS
jgi:tetratricopeptide (TPR) repeat protein